MLDCGAWAEEAHLSYVSVLLGAAVNYWPVMKTEAGKWSLTCTAGNATGQETAPSRRYRTCPPYRQYRFGLVAVPDRREDTHIRVAEEQPGGGTLETWIPRHEAQPLEDSYSGFAQFDLRASINVVHQMNSGDLSSLRGAHFVMLQLEGDEPGAVHGHEVLRPRLLHAAQWLRANGEYLRLLARCLQLLYPAKFPENAYAEGAEKPGLKDVLLAIVARDMYRPEQGGASQPALLGPAPDWLQYAEPPKAESSFSALELCWYQAFCRLRVFWERYGAAVKSWTATEADAMRRKERNEPLDRAPKGGARGCGKDATAGKRKWCLTCRVLIVINATLFQFEPRNLKDCALDAFFREHRIRRAGPQEGPGDWQRLPKYTGEGLPSLFQYPHSVSLHLGTGRILTAAWVPGAYTREKTVLDLLRAKYRSVPAAAWAGMGLKERGAPGEAVPREEDVLKRALNSFRLEPSDWALYPQRVGFEVEDSIKWVTPESKSESLSSAYRRATDGGKVQASRPQLRVSEGFFPEQGWRLRACKALGYIVSADGVSPAASPRRAEKAPEKAKKTKEDAEAEKAPEKAKKTKEDAEPEKAARKAKRSEGKKTKEDAEAEKAARKAKKAADKAAKELKAAEWSAVKALKKAAREAGPATPRRATPRRAQEGDREGKAAKAAQRSTEKGQRAALNAQKKAAREAERATLRSAQAERRLAGEKLKAAKAAQRLVEKEHRAALKAHNKAAMEAREAMSGLPRRGRGADS